MCKVRESSFPGAAQDSTIIGSSPAMTKVENYFELLDLPVSFEIDVKQLEQNYFTQQRGHHPDKIIGRAAEERQKLLARSMQINDAYKTLKDPLLRARYMLRRQGIEVGGENDPVKPSQPLLLQVMEWREAVSEIADKNALERLGDTLAFRQNEVLRGLKDSFGNSRFAEAAQHTLELGYIEKILYELRQKAVRIA